MPSYRIHRDSKLIIESGTLADPTYSGLSFEVAGQTFRRLGDAVNASTIPVRNLHSGVAWLDNREQTFQGPTTFAQPLVVQPATAFGHAVTMAQLTGGFSGLVVDEISGLSSTIQNSQSRLTVLEPRVATLQGNHSGLDIRTQATQSDVVVLRANHSGLDARTIAIQARASTLGTMSAQNTNSVLITGGGLSGVTLGVGTKIGLGSDATGDMHYRAANGTLTRIAPGTTGEVLTWGAGFPGWNANSILTVANQAERLALTGLPNLQPVRQGTEGVSEVVAVVTVADFEGSLTGTFLTFYDREGTTYCLWFYNTTSSSGSAPAADYPIQVNFTEGITAEDIALAIFNALVSEGVWTAAFDTNRVGDAVYVTSRMHGDFTPALAGGTGFSTEALTEGVADDFRFFLTIDNTRLFDDVLGWAEVSSALSDAVVTLLRSSDNVAFRTTLGLATTSSPTFVGQTLANTSTTTGLAPALVLNQDSSGPKWRIIASRAGDNVAVGTITTGATTTVNTSSAHGVTTGETVRLEGVIGATAAALNGVAAIATVTDTDSFTLPITTSGSLTGGTVYTKALWRGLSLTYNLYWDVDGTAHNDDAGFTTFQKTFEAGYQNSGVTVSEDVTTIASRRIHYSWVNTNDSTKAVVQWFASTSIIIPATDTTSAVALDIQHPMGGEGAGTGNRTTLRIFNTNDNPGTSRGSVVNFTGTNQTWYLGSDPTTSGVKGFSLLETALGTVWSVNSAGVVDFAARPTTGGESFGLTSFSAYASTLAAYGATVHTVVSIGGSPGVAVVADTDRYVMQPLDSEQYNGKTVVLKMVVAVNGTSAGNLRPYFAFGSIITALDGSTTDSVNISNGPLGETGSGGLTAPAPTVANKVIEYSSDPITIGTARTWMTAGWGLQRSHVDDTNTDTAYILEVQIRIAEQP